MSLLQTHGVSTPQAVLAPALLARKRELGAFYTPSNVTKILCDWAIQSVDDVVLEPSFGGCTFLEASVRRMQELGDTTAANLYGCDIDPEAFEFLRTRVPGIRVENFHLCDFLKWKPQNIPGQYVNAVIGNPPYIRYSRLRAEQQAAIHEWEVKFGLRLNRRASLWTYFTFHALNFLKENGRMAWVLPLSLMSAKYAESLRIALSERFRKIAFFTLSERIFLMEGTEERALIVLASGFVNVAKQVETTSSYLNSLDELEGAIRGWDASPSATPSGLTLSQGFVPAEAGKLMSQLALASDVKRLGDLAEIGIGFVTGDTKYFVKTQDEWRSLGINRSHLSYVVPRSRWVTGLSLTDNDRESHEQEGVACLALDVPVSPRASVLVNYLAQYSEEKIVKNATFSKRAQWFRFLSETSPDALFVFMTHLGPRMVVNQTKADTSNGLYRVKFKAGAKRKAKLIAISMQTTFTQLAAEQLGRARGSGALKMEPSDAKLLPIFLPRKKPDQIRKAFEDINRLMRSGNASLARQAADKFIFSGSKIFKENLRTLEVYLEMVRRRRMRDMPRTVRT